MKIPLQLGLALALLALQASLLRLAGGALPMALPLAMVVHLGLDAGTVEGAVGAALVGYAMDAVSGGPRGLLTFLSVLLFLGSRLAGTVVDLRGRAAFALLAGAGTFLVGLADFLLTRYVSPPEAAPGAGVLWRILVESAVTGALSPAVLWTMRRVDALFEKEEPGLLR